jgi:hypothetical protein
MNSEFRCEGSIVLGKLPWEVSEKLAQFSGNWLEFSPGSNAIVVRKSLPLGCPATTAVSCELISIIGSLPAEERLASPGGEISILSGGKQVMKFSMQQGEIRIRWPYEEEAYRIVPAQCCGNTHVEAAGTLVNGWARFVGNPEKLNQLEEFVGKYEGLFPEEDMPSEAEQNIVFVRFKDVCSSPAELIETMNSLADTPDSIEGELEISPARQQEGNQVQRIVIDGGRIQ